MVSCQLILGLIRTPLVGGYLLSSTIEHLPDLEEALKRFKDPILHGDLNMDLYMARIRCIQQVADLLAEYGLIDLVYQLHQYRRFWNLKTWYQVR